MATQNWIKTYVIQILPVLALIVYIIGFAYYIVYYYQFGINITSYITLTEVLVSTLTPILVAIIISAFFFSCQILFRVPKGIIRIFFIKLKTEPTSKILSEKFVDTLLLFRRKLLLSNRKNAEKNKRNNYQKFLLSIVVMFIIIFICIPYSIYVGKIEVQYKYYWITILLTLCLPYIGYYLHYYRQMRFQTARHFHNFTTSVILSISVLIFIVNLAVYNAEQDKQDGELKFKILASDNIEYTNRNYNYIGECAAAIFLYNRIDESTLILNTSKLSSIVLYNKRCSIYTKAVEEFKKMNEEQRRK